jgi:hypothetical protein
MKGGIGGRGSGVQEGKGTGKRRGEKRNAHYLCKLSSSVIFDQKLFLVDVGIH